MENQTWLRHDEAIVEVGGVDSFADKCYNKIVVNMPSTSIRIDSDVLMVLRELAAAQRRSMQSVLHDAIEDYRRQKFLEEANLAFAALRKDPEGWTDEQKERELWEGTIEDGLERE